MFENNVLFPYIINVEGLADKDSREEETAMFGEFCLKISDGYHWTTHEPDTKQVVTIEDDDDIHVSPIDKNGWHFPDFCLSTK